MNKTELLSQYREAGRLVRLAEDRYLELRDAKSDGCCAGKSLREVDAYDDLIRAAHSELERCRAAETRVAKLLAEV